MKNSKGFEENLYFGNKEDKPTGIIRANSGIYVDIINPKPEMFEIEDIAHALSMIPRFGGHIKIFYPVAQHCIKVFEYVNRIQDQPKQLLFDALMHDASEAYLLDIPSPIKPFLNNYQEIEDRLMKCLGEKFGFTYPLNDEIKQADKTILKYEWDNFVVNLTTTQTFDQNKCKNRFLELYYGLKPS